MHHKILGISRPAPTPGATERGREHENRPSQEQRVCPDQLGDPDRPGDPLTPWMSGGWGGPAASRIPACPAEPPSAGLEGVGRGWSPPSLGSWPQMKSRSLETAPAWESLFRISYKEPKQRCPRGERGPRAGRGHPSRPGLPAPG